MILYVCAITIPYPKKNFVPNPPAWPFRHPGRTSNAWCFGFLPNISMGPTSQQVPKLIVSNWWIKDTENRNIQNKRCDQEKDSERDRGVVLQGKQGKS